MRKVSIHYVAEGMLLARPIYSEDGYVLLAQGIMLTQAYIERLKGFQISEVYINDKMSENIEVHDIINDRTRLEAKLAVRKAMEEYKACKHFNVDNSKVVVNNILDELLSCNRLMVNLSDIKTVDDYTFSHSVNVCVLSLIAGIKYGLDQLKLKDLGVGALLHDIGKIMIPEEILKKPSALNDEETQHIRQHPTLGYQIVKSDHNVKASSANVVLLHHERHDGTGYPRQMKGKEIHLFARIVAIADVYDALTSDRVYRKKHKPFEALEYISANANTSFDNNILQCFISSIPVFPIGSGVLLSTGEKAIVVAVNKNLPTRPIIRMIYQADGSKKEDLEEIDLSKTLNIIVIDTCDF